MLNQDQVGMVSSSQCASAKESQVNSLMRERRHALGWTQFDLAQLSGLGIRDVYAMERFRCMPGELRIVNYKLMRVAQTLEIDFDQLFPADYLQMLQRIKYPQPCGAFRWVREIYLDELSEEDLPAALIDDSVERAEHHVYHQYLRQTVEQLLDEISPREQLVMKKYFGLDGGDPQTLEQVGQSLGVSRGRVQQIEARALKRLRHPSRSRRLRVFCESPW